jgi:putative membrane protein
MVMLSEQYFSEIDLQEITKAVKAAEANTSGELAVHIAQRSYKWFFEKSLISICMFILTFFITLNVTAQYNWGTYLNFSQSLLYACIAFIIGYFLVARFMKNRGRKYFKVWYKAMNIFQSLGKTKGSTGVLIFISLEENMAAIVADKGINSKVRASFWDSARVLITEAMQKGNHAEGIISAIKVIGDKLAVEFPRQADDENELPDEPVIE